MNSINFSLVTPEKTVLKRQLVSLTCPTTLGYITILPGHDSLVASLVAGELHAKAEKGEDFYIFVSGGFVQINPHNEVIILADSAEHHYEIDEQRALEAKKRAQEQLAQSHIASEEYAKVSASLERSLVRINIARKHAHKKQPITSAGTFNE